MNILAAGRSPEAQARAPAPGPLGRLAAHVFWRDMMSESKKKKTGGGARDSAQQRTDRNAAARAIQAMLEGRLHKASHGADRDADRGGQGQAMGQAAKDVADAFDSFRTDPQDHTAAENGARLAEMGVGEEAIARLLPVLVSALEADCAGAGTSASLAGDFVAALLEGALTSRRDQGAKDRELLSRARAETDQINRLLGAFAHDLNNVLTAISGFLQLLLLEAQPDSQLHADIMRMKGVVAHGADLIKQIRHLSKRADDSPQESPPVWDGTRTPVTGAVLVVDDEPAVRDVMARTLAALGYTVRSAASGAEALTMFTDEAYDCVVLDVIMPNLGGMETLKRLKAARPGVPVLVVTGSTSEGLRAGFTAHGADGFMEKPIDFMIFAERVRSLISRAGR